MSSTIWNKEAKRLINEIPVPSEGIFFVKGFMNVSSSESKASKRHKQNVL